MKKIFVMMAILLSAAGVWLAPSAMAADPVAAPTDTRPGWEICKDITDPQLREAAGCGNEDTIDMRFAGVISTIIWAVAIVAVMMIIYGGLQYVLSQGDAGKNKKARDTILYSVIGLVVALAAQAIVAFVFSAIWNSPPAEEGVSHVRYVDEGVEA
jgi:hypothetical protein